ncbi:hypothetical protein PR048_022497 [Dryococelus australis]|uniref:Uncharacterized protein n=1 Tax=Dryococelus australis TaxID=614101 RepID=A0ABQ9H193_9NEOP|nr:hypothetical protein PR048_022497 [Dryococelus australis]
MTFPNRSSSDTSGYLVHALRHKSPQPEVCCIQVRRACRPSNGHASSNTPSVKCCVQEAGAAVVQWLDFSPPTRFGFYSRRLDSRIFACGNRVERCRKSTGFLGDLPFSPYFNSGAAPYLVSPSSALETSTSRSAHISAAQSPQLGFTQFGRLLTSWYCEPMRGEASCAWRILERKGGENGRSPRKLAIVRLDSREVPPLLAASWQVGVSTTYKSIACLRGDQRGKFPWNVLPFSIHHKGVGLTSVVRPYSFVVADAERVEDGRDVDVPEHTPAAGSASTRIHTAVNICTHRFWAALNREVLIADEGKMMWIWTSTGTQRQGEAGDPQENPLTSGMVRYDSYVRKSGVDPFGNRIRFVLEGGEHPTRAGSPPSLLSGLMALLKYISINADTRDYFRLPSTTRDYLRLPVTTCDNLRLSVSTCDYLRLPVTICDYT